MEYYKKLCLIAGVLGVTLLGGCADSGSSSTEQQTTAAVIETMDDNKETEEQVEETEEATDVETEEASEGVETEEESFDDSQIEESPDEFDDIMDYCAQVAPGTAGSSIRMMKAAAFLMDWSEEMKDMITEDSMKTLFTYWVEDHSQEDQDKLAESWEDITATMEDIAADPEYYKERLEDNSYKLSHESYDTETIQMIGRAISAVLGL